MNCCGVQNGESRDDNDGRCSFFPYRNPWLIASQVFQITAFVLAYKFMGVFFIGFVAMVMQQLLWCCRQTKTELLLSSMLSLLAAGLALWSGIYLLVNYRDPDWCEPIFFFFYWKPNLECGDRDYAAFAFSSAALYLASAVFTMVCVKRERNKPRVGTSIVHFDIEIGMDDYPKKRSQSQKSAFAITKSEQFAPPRGVHTPSTSRSQSRKSTIDITKSVQFAPPLSSPSYHSVRSQSRKSTIDITKSEQFAPPLKVLESHSDHSRKSTIDITKSEQFAPPLEVLKSHSDHSRKSTIDITKSDQFAPPLEVLESHSDHSRKSTIDITKSEQFAPP